MTISPFVVRSSASTIGREQQLVARCDFNCSPVEHIERFRLFLRKDADLATFFASPDSVLPNVHNLRGLVFSNAFYVLVKSEELSRTIVPHIALLAVVQFSEMSRLT